jgi:hypothetical protein
MYEDNYVSLAILSGEKGKFFPNMTKDHKTSSKQFGLMNDKRYSNYISLNNFNRPQRTEVNVENINGFMFDFDCGDIKKLEKIKSELGTPTFEINTTPSKNKWQYIYLFDTPLKDKKMFSKHKVFSKTLTDYFKSDHTFDLARVFRFPSSVNHKNGEMGQFINNEIKYNYNHFIDFINKNGIELSHLVETKPKKIEKNSSIPKNKLNRKADKEFLDLYDSYMNTNGNDNSKARMSFVRALINKRMNDNQILKICDCMGFDNADSIRIINKIRRF